MPLPPLETTRYKVAEGIATITLNTLRIYESLKPVIGAIMAVTPQHR